MTEKESCHTCQKIKKQHLCLCTNFCEEQINNLIKSQRKDTNECSECHEMSDAIVDAFKTNKRMAKLIEMREFLAKNSRKYYLTKTIIKIKL